jgi:ABC-type sugar transport system permease subunit
MAFFLVMLVIFNQVYLYPVNHLFTNFMPVRMTDFLHFYLENELYRICGFRISCMSWSIIVSLILSVTFLVVGVTALRVNRKKGIIQKDDCQKAILLRLKQKCCFNSNNGV